MPHQRARGPFILVVVALLGSCRGGAESTALHPSSLVLSPGVPTDVEVRITFNPLPTRHDSFSVQIWEDDYGRDSDKIADPVRITVSPPLPTGQSYASATFKLECKELKADDKFDLSGPSGSSMGEVTHHVYSHDGGAPDSANIEVTCKIPNIPVTEEPSSERTDGAVYCVYKVNRVVGEGAEHTNNKVCVRCTTPTEGCPTNAVLDHGQGTTWEVTREGATCQTCPDGVIPFLKKR